MPFTTEKESPAYQKKIKRWTRRAFGAQWRWYWNVIKNECFKARRRMILQRNLFKMEPRGPNPNHRPRNEALWNAVFDLRHYFEKISGRPQMGLLGQLFYPEEDEVTFNGEWYLRKDWFKNEDGAKRIETLEHFYQHNQARILETLETRIPFYAKWESAQPAVNPSVASN